MKVGKSPTRLDGAEKVTGAARYVDDLVMEGMLYGATVRSRYAHSRYLGYELDPDYDWSEVVIATHEKVIPTERGA